MRNRLQNKRNTSPHKAPQDKHIANAIVNANATANANARANHCSHVNGTGKVPSATRSTTLPTN
eukprot:9981534-Lingulodinium_polyedra.AAC.1